MSALAVLTPAPDIETLRETESPGKVELKSRIPPEVWLNEMVVSQVLLAGCAQTPGTKPNINNEMAK